MANGVEFRMHGCDIDVALEDPGVFVRIDGREVIYWDTTDSSHKQQGYEIAEGLKVLYEDGPTAFMKWAETPRSEKGR